jgi:cysteinyl-tRNA synthetase
MQAKAALERLTTAKSTLEFITDNGGADGLSDSEATFVDSLPLYRERFIAAMDDDFNTADAIAVIFEMIRESNSLAAAANPSKDFANAVLAVLSEFDSVLGLFYAFDAKSDDLDSEVEALIEARQAARSEKNWAQADKIRDRLNEMGIVLEDTPQGVKWKKSER